jgi:hypothetical protein
MGIYTGHIEVYRLSFFHSRSVVFVSHSEFSETFHIFSYNAFKR